jgi:hypothetical protein
MRKMMPHWLESWPVDATPETLRLLPKAKQVEQELQDMEGYLMEAFGLYTQARNSDYNHDLWQNLIFRARACRYFVTENVQDITERIAWEAVEENPVGDAMSDFLVYVSSLAVELQDTIEHLRDAAEWKRDGTASAASLFDIMKHAVPKEASHA